MGFDKRYKTISDPSESEGNTSNDIGMNVVIDDGVFHGSCDITQVKQELSDLENIIMEGDLILKVHADGDAEDSSQKGYQLVPGECIEHANLYMHHDDTLVKIGDSFESNKEFVKYVNDNANRWCFYYKCTEAQNSDTENESYTYCCVYLKNRDYTKKKGSKKRYNCKTDCPCKVKLRRRPGGNLTVVYVCNHHDHDVSKENFNKLQNNKKLPPYIKEIIMDLLALEIEITKIRKFIEMETGVKMSRTFFYEIERKMKLNNDERQITDKRLKELSEKMRIVDEKMYDDNDNEDDTDDQLSPGTNNKRVKFTTTDGIVSKFQEAAESVKNLEASMNTDAHSSWMNDSSVSAPNRTSISGWDETTLTATKEIENSQDYNDTADHDEDYATEYAVEELIEDTADTETATPTDNFPQYETVVFQDEFGNVINCGNDEQIVILQQDENGMVQGENGSIGYFDGEQIIYMTDTNENQEHSEQIERIEEEDEAANARDAAVQTSSNTKPEHSYVPVFDVYMKNGNVTGFVVDKHSGKDDQRRSSKKLRKASKDPGPNTSQQSENSAEPDADTSQEASGYTYTKNEYIHRYNIDQYMANPQFPKYIDTLAKKTRIDVMQMFTRVYNEKAMFKMTTTQKGKEGNTKIWYLTDVRRKGKYKMSDEEQMKKDKIGQYLTDILILKERVKTLKKDNDELVTRNKYLEEVALRLAKMHEHNN